MAAAVSTLLLAAALICAAARLSTVDAKYIESVAANVDGVATLDDVTADGHHKAGGGGAGGKLPSPRRHEPFVPMVAFKCGYRNKYMERSGEWRDDASSAASCLQGKYDILKYCKRVYPTLDITNIVEYSHLSHIGKWCKEDGSACKHHYTVRPYRCIAGEFVTESLQVPSRCRFSHVAGKSKCNDYKYWSLRAESECGLKEEEDTHQSMKLHSFAILEPCGLSMFRGVEFVCCPKSVEEKIEQVVDLAKDTDEDDYDDDDDDDDQDDSSESREDLLDSSDKEQDPYFKEDPNHAIDEHERFRDAEERLEKKHRKKVTKVITEWSELFERYNKMKEKDPKGAEEYKREMTARFRKTVAALEEENKEQRTQIEEIHDERVQSALNEKKRQATHDYRAALVKQVGGAGAAANRQNVLKTLKNYIRAEEKDRTHMLNRYRHLLRADPEAAVSFEPILLHRLRYIDLRVNGTLAMLHDFPALEKQIRPVAIEYWNEYRRDNTPELVVAEVSGSDTASLLGGGEEQNERLIRFYKQTYERTHPGSSGGDATLPSSPSSTSLAVDRVAVAAAAKKVGASTATTKRASLKMVAPTELPLEEDSDEDQFDDDDEDEAEEEKLEQQKQKNQQPVDVKKQSEKFDKKLSKDGAKKLVGVLPKKTLKKLEEQESTRNANKGDDDQNDDDEDDDDDDDDDDEDSSSSSSSSSSNDDDEERYVGDAERKALRERQLNVAIEPILGADGGPQLRVHEEVAEVQPAYARRHDMLVAYNENRSPFAAVWENHTNVALGVIVCAFVVLVVGFMVKRRAARHPGFIEVDVCTPEDHHIAGMQVNGYENPTYTFYDGGATAKA